MTARDPSSFLACWELMTLVPAAAILVRRSDAAVRHAVFVYLAVTHLGGVGVWICVLALAHYGALGDPGGARRPGRRRRRRWSWSPRSSGSAPRRA